jgi:hypothetical protein
MKKLINFHNYLINDIKIEVFVNIKQFWTQSLIIYKELKSLWNDAKQRKSVDCEIKLTFNALKSYLSIKYNIIVKRQ